MNSGSHRTHWAPSIKNAEDSSSESRSAESSENTRNNRTALNPSPSKPARSLQKKYGDAFENDFRARLGLLMKIHSRFIARPLNRFTHVESIQPGFQVLSNGHESIQRTRFNGFKFNRRRPLSARLRAGRMLRNVCFRTHVIPSANSNFDPARGFHSTTAPFCFEACAPTVGCPQALSASVTKQPFLARMGLVRGYLELYRPA